MAEESNKESLKEKLYTIIFEADTPAGKAFDIALLWLILFGIILVCVESVPGYNARYYKQINILQWIVTIIFTLEYFVRVLVVQYKSKYLRSFYGVIDLLAILPAYLSAIIPGTQFTLVLRIFRLLRVFRVLRLGKYVGESYVLLNALKASRYKITVFLEGVLIVVVIAGTLMYLIEGKASGFDSIPHAIYWAIVTLTTVGFGDIAPVTPPGRALASFLMLLGYGIIAVPTGIVTAELGRPKPKKPAFICDECHANITDEDAVYCKYCGSSLSVDEKI